ncbi:MAG: hypothetical protein PHP08_03340 [Candidatus Dojkabacteria bacterium]|nr:hypothetical protein [Candidatus Dojkabacteria bacterium]
MMQVEENLPTIYISIMLSLIKRNSNHLVQNYIEQIPHHYKAQFIEQYENINPLQVIYQYMTLIPYIDNKLNISINTDKLSPLYQKHIDVLQNTLKLIYIETDFLQYYEQNIKKQEKEVINNVQVILDKNEKTYKELLNFWKPQNKPQLVVIPNIIAEGDCFGVNKNNKYYAIISPKINPETDKREFYPLHVTRICIHEFSHCFFKNNMPLNQREIEKELIKLKISTRVKEVYGDAYFEECYVRAATLYISEKSNIYNLKANELKRKIEIKLNNEIKNGFVHTKVYYNNFVKGRTI